MEAIIIDPMDFDDIDDIELIGSSRHPNKSRSRVNPFESLSDDEFKYKYRFSKPFGQIIVDLIKDKIPHDPRGATISPELQVMCALRSWARHEIQDDTVDLHGVSQPAVSKICTNVARAIAQTSQRFLKMPSTIAEQEQAMRKFRSSCEEKTIY